MRKRKNCTCGLEGIESTAVVFSCHLTPIYILAKLYFQSHSLGPKTLSYAVTLFDNKDPF